MGLGTGPHGMSPPPGPACTELMGALDTHPMSRLLWRRLKPLVLGKLLFAPDTPFTRQLMAKVRAVGVQGPSLSPSGGRPGQGEAFWDGSWKQGFEEMGVCQVAGRGTSVCQRSEAQDGAKWRQERWAGVLRGVEGQEQVGQALRPTSHR